MQIRGRENTTKRNNLNHLTSGEAGEMPITSVQQEMIDYNARGG
jgi:hypothetical protein